MAMADKELGRKIMVVGTGYAGLVTGACLAEMGREVTCVDVDAAKIASLAAGIPPLFEPGLDGLIKKNLREGRLRFSLSLPEALQDSTICFITVGTPPSADGSADLRYVLAAAREIGRHLDRYTVVVNKSTVPVGTADKVRAAVNEELRSRNKAIDFDVVSNPEFLKQGAAIEDFMKPDRIVVGADTRRARDIMRELYADFTRNHDRLLLMGVRDAEMTKYVANAMLATRISFMNEIANLCDRLEVDVESVRLGIGSDSRIGYSFLYPGCGYGGSCFPKDVKALIRMAEHHNFLPQVLEAVDQRNETQKSYLYRKICDHFQEDLRGRTFGLWGLAFKPDTDDMREAPSKVLLRQLIERGARVKAYDPVAMEVARRQVPSAWLADGRLELVAHQYEAVNGTDAMVLVTEWKPFRHPDFDALKRLMNAPVIFDGRNQYNPAHLAAIGFDYYGVGRQGKMPETVSCRSGKVRRLDLPIPPAGLRLDAQGAERTASGLSLLPGI